MGAKWCVPARRPVKIGTCKIIIIIHGNNYIVYCFTSQAHAAKFLTFFDNAIFGKRQRLPVFYGSYVELSFKRALTENTETMQPAQKYLEHCNFFADTYSMKNWFFSVTLFFIPLGVIFCADLVIDAADVRLEPVYETTGGAGASGIFSRIAGYHLYIRKKPDVLSVLLTETTKDPEGREDNYAYRATEWNAVNGDETRYLNGAPLESEYARYSIIDSTPEPDAQFGQAFHVYIPRVMVYGYPWSRNGQVTIDRGVFINIRAFGSLHADYTNGFDDNPFMFDFTALPQEAAATIPSLTDAYSDKAVAAFTDIADFGGGSFVFSKGADDIVEKLTESFAAIPKERFVDVVIALDATGSMKDDVAKLREEWMPALIKALADFEDVRLGLLLYRDYEDSFKYQGLPVRFFPFTRDVNAFFKNLNSFVIRGNEGADVPEPVYEALWASMEYFEWSDEAQKKVILVGDAEPHPVPRGTRKYTKDLVAKTAREKNIIIDTIIVPDDKLKRRAEDSASTASF